MSGIDSNNHDIDDDDKRNKTSAVPAKQRRDLAKVCAEAVITACGAFGIASMLVLTADLLHKNNNYLDSSPALGYAYDNADIGRNGAISQTKNRQFSPSGHDTESPLAGILGTQNTASNQCSVGKAEPSDADLQVARIAWTYFENNYNPETGLVNSVNGYPSTTMWDTGSALAAFIAAREFGFIGQKEFDDAIMKLISSLQRMELFEGKAPNKVYHTKTLEMVDYGNNPVKGGIGVSVLDLARLVSWMNTLQCMHPKYAVPAGSALSRWDYSDLINNQEMYGYAREPLTGKIRILQEGRLGYEQYAGKIFHNAGFPVATAKSYENEHRSEIEILGINIAHDSRDPRIYHANNYVVTESYAMDAMELGVDDENRELIKRIFDVQKKRWQETGIVTAISEDNINQEPWFLYNTIFNAGIKFNTTTDTGVQYDHLKSVSTKAAISMALLFPDDEYSSVLLSTIESAYDPDIGWYSGVYELGGYNDATTANTNGVILSTLLYKKYGTIYHHCDKCSGRIDIQSSVKQVEEDSSADLAIPCDSCETTR